MQQSGYLLLADLSGYTEFVTQTELDHGAALLENLMRVLIDEVRAPFTVQEIEGDAIFIYAPSDGLQRGVLLVDVIEGMYRAFRTSLDDTERNSTCECRACASAGNLDLKFVAHYGTFATRGISGHEGISGPDVILVHRLLKNRIVEETGLGAYAFYSRAAVDAIDVAGLTEDMVAHAEEYEHLGEVGGFVQDMAAFWRRDMESRHVVVPPDGALLVMVRDVSAPPLVAWEAYTNPRHRRVWMFSDEYRFEGFGGGRFGSQTTEHCVHGKTVSAHVTLDWKPIRYFTQGIIIPLGGIMPTMGRFDPIDGGTRVTIIVGRPQHERWVLRTWLRTILVLLGPSLRKDFTRNYEKYFEIVEAMAADYRSTPSSSPE